jgi:hypothetical protein
MGPARELPRMEVASRGAASNENKKADLARAFSISRRA